MSEIRPAPMILLACALAAQARAQETQELLTRVDRAIRREPIYCCGNATYGLLAFGARAAFRVWLVQDGDVLYVDRDGDGDLTEAGEAVFLSGSTFEVGAIVEPDGARHTGLRVRRMGDRLRVTLLLRGRSRLYVGYDTADPLRFAARPEEAPVIHLGGPLSIRFYERPPDLATGQSSLVNVAVGTPGLGRGSFAAVRCSTLIDRDAAPVAEFEFPRRDGEPGPIRIRVIVGED
jgi:hypothetical protein